MKLTRPMLVCNAALFCARKACSLQVATPGGSLGCNALVYKLRSPDAAVLDLYAALSRHHTGKIDPR